MDNLKYFYPDVNDNLTIKMIEKVEKHSGYWELSENKVLKITEDYINKLSINKLNLIDAGCGDGRLIWKFEKYFNNIIAIEPDKSRIKKAEDTAIKNNLNNKILLLSEMIEDININIEVDVVICSHVIQHVKTKSVLNILKKINQLLKPNGLLILMTCYSYNEDYYAKQYSENNYLYEKIINIKEFNKLISNDNKILPLHFFSYDSLEKVLLETNFIIEEHKLYHFNKDNKARDVLLIAYKNNIYI